MSNFYCDCLESWEAAGIEVPRLYQRMGQYIFREVQVDKEHICVHCGHHAVFSKVPLSENFAKEVKERTE